jgi:RNA polymerase sigma-70 factor (ECF subfamily)
MQDRNEAALIERIRAGESSLFEDLIGPYQGRVYQAVLRITRNAADAADIYQEAMLTAFEKIGDFRGDAAFKTWIFRIAVNHALMRHRKAKRSPIVAEEDLPEFNWMGGFARPVHNWADSTEAAAQRTQLRAALQDALEKLPDVDRTIVWLKDVEGLSHAEIAEATDSTVLAVRTRLHRARLRLREWLGDRFGEPV